MKHSAKHRYVNKRLKLSLTEWGRKTVKFHDRNSISRKINFIMLQMNYLIRSIFLINNSPKLLAKITRSSGVGRLLS